MKEKHPIRSMLASLILGILLSSSGQQISFAQLVSEDQVKAAYVYNFAKFAEWPPAAFTGPSDPIRLCVLNDQPFQLKLTQIVKDKNIAGRHLVAVPIQSSGQTRSCHVLFINSTQNEELPHILDTLQGSSVLVVGEADGFADRGGTINFVLQSGQVHFQVNHKAATQSGIRLSSRLLSVATRVIE